MIKTVMMMMVVDCNRNPRKSRMINEKKADGGKGHAVDGLAVMTGSAGRQQDK